MSIAFTDEQNQFRETLQRFFATHSPSSAVRAAMETESGFDLELWQRMCEELGVAGLPIPESYGGAGFGHTELGIAVEEMGRALYCGPYFSSVVLAANVLLVAAIDEVKTRYLPRIADGSLRACFAIAEPRTTIWEYDSFTTCASTRADGTVLDGTKSHVIDGATAELLIVLARTGTDDTRLALYAVDATQANLSVDNQMTIDTTRRLATIRFEQTTAELISTPQFDAVQLEQFLDVAAIALAHESVGGAQNCLDSAVEYAKLRMQFGRPIGSFQAVKHKCADRLLDLEHAKSATYHAAAVADGVITDDLAAAAATAKAASSECFMRTAADTIQIYGGIGFTWDNDSHLWYKRAKSSEVLLGTPDYHRERYLRRREVA